MNTTVGKKPHTVHATGGKLAPTGYAVRPPSGGKRVAAAPLTNSSDEDSDTGDCQTPRVIHINTGRPKEVDSSPSPGPISPGLSTSSDYENVASPTSSTASGPVYVRPPGFTHHGQEILCTKNKSKKKKAFVSLKEGLKKKEPIPPQKTRTKRDPVPMRLRALPQSFWQQPNVSHHVPPGSAYPVLPPLQKEVDVIDIRPVTPPEDKTDKTVIRPKQGDRKMTVANTDLLFKLFDGVSGEENKKSSSVQIKRGRPRKVTAAPSKQFVSGEDPYLVDAVAEKLFPTLSLENGGKAFAGHSSLQVVTLREGDKSVMLPSLSREQNYSQMLTEIVSHM